MINLYIIRKLNVWESEKRKENIIERNSNKS